MLSNMVKTQSKIKPDVRQGTTDVQKQKEKPTHDNVCYVKRIYFSRIAG